MVEAAGAVGQGTRHVGDPGRRRTSFRYANGGTSIRVQRELSNLAGLASSPLPHGLEHQSQFLTRDPSAAYHQAGELLDVCDVVEWVGI